MNKLLFDDLLALGRKTVLAAVTRALEQKNERRPWPLVVDATAGNGNDTEFLAQAVEKDGQVLAFDVQAEAIANTRKRLERARVAERARLLHESHDRVGSFVRPGQLLAASMFNLGFLPGSDSTLATRSDTTVAALAQLAPLTMPGGLVSVHCYLGQDGGAAEADAVGVWASQLPWADWRVARYEFWNKPSNKEILFLAQKM